MLKILQKVRNNRMNIKKIIIVAILFLSIVIITGCSGENIKTQRKVNDNQEKIVRKITTVEKENDKIIINTEDITSETTFVNYELDGVIIQFVVVRGTDKKVRIAFNTCQACNPSPNAYFIQKDEYLQCQNCGNRFHIDKIGVEKGGCNPAPVEEKEEKENRIIIDKKYVDSHKEKFKNWNGPTKKF